MTQPSEFQTELQNAIERYAMLKHPFYQLWSAGELDVDVLREYAKQYYAHVKAFPTYVSATHSHCEDFAVRQMLLENLIEEERGENNHPELWLRFAESLGLTRDEVKSAELLPSTVDSVNRLKALTQSEDYRRGVAALYAYESQIPEVARTKRSGLAEFYGIEDSRAVSFFTVHEDADEWHREIELKVLSEACNSDDNREAVVSAAGEAAKALWDFLTGVEAAFVKSDICDTAAAA
ncbi:MAG: CADD family putative folate metabolism protein [Acidobacteriota bacterium]